MLRLGIYPSGPEILGRTDARLKNRYGARLCMAEVWQKKGRFSAMPARH